MRHILLIHSDDVVMNALGLVLQQEGYRLGSGTSADAMGGSDADLVLLDGAGEEVWGHGMVADLKLSLGVDAPVYLFGAESDEELRIRAEAVGADGYVCTEWGFRRLISVVRWAVRKGNAKPEVRNSDHAMLGSLSRLLVLDDHDGARARLVTELRNHGYAVQGCANEAELGPLLTSFDPDVVLTDVVLDGDAGDEVCRRLKSRSGARIIPVVLISSLPERELATRAQRAGADGYFRKQDGLHKLVQMVESLLSEIIF